MKSYHILLLSLVVLSTTCFRNTTDFWLKQLNQSSLHFQSYNGYQEIDWYYPRGASGMYYSLFTALGHTLNNATDIVPVIIWLQGGPGASSQFGAFTQIGPIRIEKGVPKLFANPWNLMGHLLFIDSPLNVGFSYSGQNRTGRNQVNSTVNASEHLVNFLYNFWNDINFINLRNSQVYIAGQSFAGHYIPVLTQRILNNDTFRRITNFKLVGISIGDGWTDPITQINYYDSYLWSVGVVQRKFRDVCNWYQTNAIINIDEHRYDAATTYFDFLTNNDTTPQKYFGNISMFNFRNYNGLDESYADFLNVSKYQLDANVDFISGNDAVYTAFAHDITRSYVADVIFALQRIKVLIYNGQNDVVVNNPGVMQYLNGLNWPGIFMWKRTPKQIWSVHGQIRGWAKVSGHLWYVHVNGAGHMVPTDQPESAFNMLGHFIRSDYNWRQ